MLGAQGKEGLSLGVGPGGRWESLVGTGRGQGSLHTRAVQRPPEGFSFPESDFPSSTLSTHLRPLQRSAGTAQGWGIC